MADTSSDRDAAVLEILNVQKELLQTKAEIEREKVLSQRTRSRSQYASAILAGVGVLVAVGAVFSYDFLNRYVFVAIDERTIGIEIIAEDLAKLEQGVQEIRLELEHLPTDLNRFGIPIRAKG